MTKSIEKIMTRLLPSPFSIAIILTILIIIIALLFTENTLMHITSYWEHGLWNPGLMNFAMQMMLMLVLGYVIALSESAEIIINKITFFCKNSANAALLVSLSTIIMSLINWGLGLIFGAILARKVGEHALAKNINLNYPLIGAAGYSGLMVWHGGISGSIPLKVAEKNHFSEFISNEELPVNGINFQETIFSNMNIIASLLLITIIPCILFFIGKQQTKKNKFQFKNTESDKIITKKAEGAEKIDTSIWFSKLIGLSILGVACQNAISAQSISFINPNFVNLSLLGLAILVHKNFNTFLYSVNKAITSASGILIQFPLYFGIMGIMNSSGLVDIFANIFVEISNQKTYPILTMLSGGIVNIFVPSGGGQWAVQGPIVLQSALDLNIPIEKSIMALAYGDQLTNMLQPFWALPLLGITQLKATEILPYTILIMLIGILIFSTCLIVF
jgi:short-chain fatty acids transporter